jgi:AraC-like DNA-binding protein
MFSTVYFALTSALSLQDKLPAYSTALLDSAFDRAYCQVDDVLECSRRDLTADDIARLIALGDSSLLLGHDEDAEEAYRRAQKLLGANGDRLRIMSCRNTGWQLMLRDRYSASAKCFTRMCNDEAATDSDVLEGLLGIALVQHQIGHQTAADDALLRAAELADEHRQPGWQLLIALLAREFDVQLQIRGAATLGDHAFWTSARSSSMQSAGERTARLRHVHEATAVMSPMPLLLVQRREYLNLLDRLVQGDATAADRLFFAIDEPQRFGGAGQGFLAKLDVILAALAGGLDDIADRVLVKINRSEGEAGTRRWNVEYLYASSKVAVRRGNPAQALQFYSKYASEALRCLRLEAVEVRPLDKAHGGAHAGTAASDDVSARLPAKYRRAYRYIVDNLNRANLSTREVAAHVDVTERALQLAFKRSIGVSPSNVIRSLRLDGVRNDLLDGDWAGASIFDTASRWGVSSRSALAKGYRRQFNESPSETIYG